MHYLDGVPLSGIIRIRDLMYGIKDPFRLDQGDVSFDVPESVKRGISDALARNQTHYLQTAGVPRLRELLAEKLRRQNQIPIDDLDEIFVTNGGLHGLYLICQCLLQPGDEVVIPDPEWSPCAGCIVSAQAVPVRCPIYESRGWRFDLDELEAAITPRTRAIYVNSPHNPTGGVLTRADVERIAAIARDRNLWLISDEAYEDMLYDDAEHVSLASLPDTAERTLSLFTFSKSFAMTGLRLGYVVVPDRSLRDRFNKALFYTTGNVASVVQYGGIEALDGPQDSIAEFRCELQARRDLFYSGIDELGGIFRGTPPKGAFYAFLKIDPAWRPETDTQPSRSWAMAEHLIARGRIGSVPGVDFGPRGEGYVRFCFARERKELRGALESMRSVFGTQL